MSPISGNVTLRSPTHILLRIPTYHMHIVILRNQEVELVKKIKEINILSKSHVFLRNVTFWPLMGPISGNVTLCTPFNSSLRIHTCHIRIVILRK